MPGGVQGRNPRPTPRVALPMKRSTLALGALLALPLLTAPATLRLVRIVGDSDAPVLPDGAHAVFSLTAYDLRLPISGIVLAHMGDPVPGELILFRDPDGQLATKTVAAPPEPAEGVWVEGANAAVSRDSRHYGPVPRDAVLGRLLWSW